MPPSPPLIRLVRMTFHPAQVSVFLALFDATAPQIRGFAGCRHLELWQDARYPNQMTTYSLWDDADALEAYRNSALFKATWAKTKRLFAAPPHAWSQFNIRHIDD